MKILPILLILFTLILGCDSKVPKSNVIENLNQSKSDSLVNDSINWLEKNRTLTNNDISIFDSLTLSFNKSNFLKEIGFSNSGHEKSQYLLEPDTSGFLYSYFVFKPEFKNQGLASIDAMRVTTFKYGKDVGNYNSNEIFIELICKIKDSRLQKLDIVGAKRTAFDQYTQFKLETDSTIFYLDKPKFLLLKIKADTVKWFKFGYIKDNLNSLQKSDLQKFRI
jgi:hypothetical protein